MDTVQVITIDIPVKAYLITSKYDKMKETLRKYAIKYLKHSSNYFANGIIYPASVNVLYWKTGIKRGSILGDEMIFTTTIQACFRMYPIGSIQTGYIVGINASHVQINNEYIYDIHIPLVKTSNKVEMSVQSSQPSVVQQHIEDDEKDNEDMSMIKIEESLQNNNENYPYLNKDLNLSDLAVGQTVEFIVLDLSSKYNPGKIVVIGFLTRIIDSYTKIYSTNCDQYILNYPISMNNVNSTYKLSINDILPTYYTQQYTRYMISNDDIPFDNVTKVDVPVNNSYMCYYIKNPDLNTNIMQNLNEQNVLILELQLNNDVTNPFTPEQYKNLCSHFVNITAYYDWSSSMNGMYTLWLVCSYYLN